MVKPLIRNVTVMGKSKLDMLIEEYTNALPGKLITIKNEWDKIRAHDWNMEEWDAFYRLLHTNCGSSGCYGYGKLSEQLRIVCNMVKRFVKSPPSKDDIEYINNRITIILLNKTFLIKE